MGNRSTHRYTATPLYFTEVNLYIEFKQSLKDTICVTGEVSLLREGLLIGWGTLVSAALSSRQVQRCWRAWCILHLRWHLMLAIAFGEVHVFAYGFYECSVFFYVDHSEGIFYIQWGVVMISTTSVVEICEEVQGLIQIIIVSLGYLRGSSSHLNLSCFCSALTPSHSHVLLPFLLHQHLCFDCGSHSQLLWGRELAHPAVIHELILTTNMGRQGSREWQRQGCGSPDLDRLNLLGICILDTVCVCQCHYLHTVPQGSWRDYHVKTASRHW